MDFLAHHADAYDAVDGFEGLYDVGRQVVMGIDHGVSDVLAGLVDQVLDVDVALRQLRGDLGKHVGDVLIDDGDSVLFRRLQIARGEIY